MNKTEILACIYKHVGRTDDLENLSELADEIARTSAEEEREACSERAADAVDAELETGDGESLREHVRNAVMRSNGEGKRP